MHSKHKAYLSVDRRRFMMLLAATSSAVLTGLPGAPVQASTARPKTGVQLYMLRNSMAADFEGTLDAVAALGIRNLEFAGFYDRSVKQMKATLSARELNPVSAHCLTAFMPDSEAARIIDYCAELGIDYVVAAIPFMKVLAEGGEWDNAMRKTTRDDFLFSAERFNRFGEIAKAAGLQFCYHNHAFDFNRFEGKHGLDILLHSADKHLVKLQLDIGNTTMAGIDPLAYLEKYGDRIPSVHMKDWQKPFTPSLYDMPPPTPLGTGVTDWSRVYARLKKIGAEYMFIEHENMPIDKELGALTDNLRNLEMVIEKA
ncbi:sugar phosphate isomerase/epimerase family protein [Kordiimonas aestuarii]|uniref:sugar phosphate isomerase/epimerase family protein n=1 Tax=Kordiimonas aestuarii TaxID=1005925 RepID=UPI0021CF57F4|nr:sugar phosphate isomerase/epimerase [Kordiimonas aestuarii]